VGQSSEIAVNCFDTIATAVCYEVESIE